MTKMIISYRHINLSKANNKKQGAYRMIEYLLASDKKNIILK